MHACTSSTSLAVSLDTLLQRRLGVQISEAFSQGVSAGAVSWNATNFATWRARSIADLDRSWLVSDAVQQ